MQQLTKGCKNKKKARGAVSATAVSPHAPPAAVSVTRAIHDKFTSRETTREILRLCALRHPSRQVLPLVVSFTSGRSRKAWVKGAYGKEGPVRFFSASTSRKVMSACRNKLDKDLIAFVWASDGGPKSHGVTNCHALIFIWQTDLSVRLFQPLRSRAGSTEAIVVKLCKLVNRPVSSVMISYGDQGDNDRDCVVRCLTWAEAWMHDTVFEWV